MEPIRSLPCFTSSFPSLQSFSLQQSGKKSGLSSFLFNLFIFFCSYAFDTIESGQMLFGAASFLGFIPYIIVFMIKSFQVLCSIIVIATQFFGISALCQISKHCLKIIQNVAFCHFSPFFVHLKVTCLVTLFWTFAILMNFCPLKM